MAGYDIFFTGFEGGKRDWDSSQSQTLFVDDGLARTGEYDLLCYAGVAAAQEGVISFPAPTAGQNITSSYACGKCRVFFTLKAAPSADHVMIMGYCVYQTANTGGTLRLKTNRTFAANAYGTTGTYSTAVLALDTIYRADLTLTLTDVGAASSAVVSISIYTEAGVLIETVTSSASGLADNPDFPRPSLGHHDSVVSTYHVRFDDFYSQVLDAAIPNLPTATRITRVDATSRDGTVGSGWAGIYQNIINIPFGASTVDAIVSSTLDSKIKFSHAPASTLALSGIEGFNIYSHIKASSMGDENILINDNIHVQAVDTTYSTYPYFLQQMSALSSPDFNTLTFGVMNRRAQTVTLAQQYMEVLHAGNNLPRDLTGEESWKHKTIEFVADGSFNEVTGVGFRSQVIILKKYDGTDSAGFFKVGCNGGTQSRVINATTIDPLAIMYVTDDGFTYGPSLEAGMTYVALCIQDGGVEEDCKFMRYGAFVGFPSGPTSVTIKASWEPDFVMVQGDDVLVYVTDLETPGDSIPINTSSVVTGYIATLTSSGFTIGANLDNGRVYYYFAIRMLIGLDDLFDFGLFVASGDTHVVTGVDFEPAFAVGKRIT